MISPLMSKGAFPCMLCLFPLLLQGCWGGKGGEGTYLLPRELIGLIEVDLQDGALSSSGRSYIGRLGGIAWMCMESREWNWERSSCALGRFEAQDRAWAMEVLRDSLSQPGLSAYERIDLLLTAVILRKGDDLVRDGLVDLVGHADIEVGAKAVLGLGRLGIDVSDSIEGVLIPLRETDGWLRLLPQFASMAAEGDLSPVARMTIAKLVLCEFDSLDRLGISFRLSNPYQQAMCALGAAARADGSEVADKAVRLLRGYYNQADGVPVSVPSFWEIVDEPGLERAADVFLGRFSGRLYCYVARSESDEVVVRYQVGGTAYRWTELEVTFVRVRDLWIPDRWTCSFSIR